MIWLIGNKGMLGRQIEIELKKNNFNFIGTDKEINIINFNELNNFAQNKSFDIIINCSAYTAVDKAEKEKKLAYQINAYGVENISRIALKYNSKLMHFSTDYVFSGNISIPYKETDIPDPKSTYGLSKLKGEILLIKNIDKFFIIRISWLYGIYGKNFVNTMLKLFKEKDELNVVVDQIGSPTYAGELAYNIINHIIKNNSENYGIYHYSDDGTISWFDFANQIEEYAYKNDFIKKRVKINPILTSLYPTPAQRPQYSILDKSKIKNMLNFRIINWKDNLNEYFNEQIRESKKIETF